MSVRDKFTRGWLAGFCGGLSGGIFGYLPYYIGISTMRFIDWSAILVFGREQPFSLADQVYGLFVLAWSSGCNGIVFAFLLQFITEKNIYFKGWIIFLIPWWIIYLFTALAKTEGTLNLPVMTPLSNGISASIVGLTAVYCYRLLEPKN